MSESSKGVRTLPAALTLGFAIGFVMLAARVVFVHVEPEPLRAVRFHLIGEGATVASIALCLFGAFELARRQTGRAALGIKLAGIGFAGVLAIDVSYTAINFIDEPWKHAWISQTFEYTFFAAWLLVPIGLAVAHGGERRDIAGAVVIVSLLAWPPPFLAKTLYSWLPEGKTGWTVELVLLAFRFVVLFAAFAALARGAAVADRTMAASGLRLAARSLWLRVVAVVALPLVMLLVIANAHQSAAEMLKLVSLAVPVVLMISLVQFGVGATRAARAVLSDLERWPLVVGAAASLWGVGVLLGRVPWLYRTLYKDTGGFLRRNAQEFIEALSITMPLVVTAGVAAIAVAIGGFAARNGNSDLRGHVQAKTAGFVSLMLVSIAIQSWMLPEADTLATQVMLILFAGGAGLVAIVMMAQLLGLAADALESEPGLPAATVVT